MEEAKVKRERERLSKIAKILEMEIEDPTNKLEDGSIDSTHIVAKMTHFFDESEIRAIAKRKGYF